MQYHVVFCIFIVVFYCFGGKLNEKESVYFISDFYACAKLQ